MTVTTDPAVAAWTEAAAFHDREIERATQPMTPPEERVPASRLVAAFHARRAPFADGLPEHAVRPGWTSEARFADNVVAKHQSDAQLATYLTADGPVPIRCATASATPPGWSPSPSPAVCTIAHPLDCHRPEPEPVGNITATGHRVACPWADVLADPTGPKCRCDLLGRIIDAERGAADPFVYHGPAGWHCTSHGSLGSAHYVRSDRTPLCGVCVTPPAPPRETQPAAAGPDAYDLADAIDRLLTGHRWEVIHGHDATGPDAQLVVTDHDDPGNPKTYTVTVTPGAPQATPGPSLTDAERIAISAVVHQNYYMPDVFATVERIIAGRTSPAESAEPVMATCGRDDCDDHRPEPVECDLADLAPAFPDTPAEDDGTGWAPFGTHIACPVALEFRGEDEAGMPRQERVTGMHPDTVREIETMATRLAVARHALAQIGYFTAEEVGEDVAPRITEYASHMTAQLAEARAAAIKGWRAYFAHTTVQDRHAFAADRRWPDWLTTAVEAVL